MITLEQVNTMNKMLCECEGEEHKCPNCLFKELITHLSGKQIALNTMISSAMLENEEIMAEVKQMRKAIKHQNRIHEMHIEALQHYYHVIHKDCPCLIKLKGVTGKCGSPWVTERVN